MQKSPVFTIFRPVRRIEGIRVCSKMFKAVGADTCKSPGSAVIFSWPPPIIENPVFLDHPAIFYIRSPVHPIPAAFYMLLIAAFVQLEVWAGLNHRYIHRHMFPFNLTIIGFCVDVITLHILSLDRKSLSNW